MTIHTPQPGPSHLLLHHLDSPPRGRSASPSPLEHNMSSAPPSRSGSPRGRLPPSYARSSLDRSPRLNPMMPDDRPSVPPPIFLRSSSPAALSSKGTLKIHIPAWGVAMVKPPRRLELHPLENGGREPPTEDTVLTGALEVVMKERRRCVAISVGVQSVCRLHLGAERGWEEDGVFERGVEILGGSAEGIWLEKGSQSFTFSILLPATLATNDYHQFGRLSAILTARVEGSQSTSSISSIFKRDVTPTGVSSDIPFKEDFDTVIARSDKVAHRAHRSSSRDSPRDVITPPAHSPGLNEGPPDDTAISMGDLNPSVTGLYHRQQSADFPRQSSSFHPSRLGVDEDGRPTISHRSSGSDVAAKLEKHGWLKGDLTATRSLIIHANPDPLGGVCQLDLRKEGLVAGLGSWRFTASSDVFAISAVLILSLSIPSPVPACTIFFTRLLLSQTYKIISPRTPNDVPHQPEQARNHVLYQVGKPHRTGDRFPEHDVEALWRGSEVGGASDQEEGWRTRAVARMPVHEKIRPSTNDGTITPIRVAHELILQVFYSVEGETVAGAVRAGPGELRMMAVKMPVLVPSCTISSSAVNLPSYESCPATSDNIDEILSSPPSKSRCMCGSTFAELGEAAMRRLHQAEAEDVEERERVRLGFNGLNLERSRSGDAIDEYYQARKEESEGRSTTPGAGGSGVPGGQGALGAPAGQGGGGGPAGPG